MRFYNHINEVLKIDKKLVKKVFSDKNTVEYEARNKIGKEEIFVFVTIKDIYHNEPTGWDIEFGIETKNDTFISNKIDFSITLKESIQIFNIIASAVDDFIRTKKPDKFGFSEQTGMKGGIKLYSKFAKQIIKQYPYKLKIITNTFIFTRIDK